MARKQMWIGPKGFETWIKAPAISPDYSRVGYSRDAQHLNGGITVQRSVASHAAYEMTFNKLKREEAEVLLGLAGGLMGDDLIYFVDPVAADRNVANQMWATPSLAGFDGLPIFQDQEPGLIPNVVDQNTRYPRFQAVYRAAGVSETFYVPIPPGYCAWVGVHGSATGAAGMQVKPLIGQNYQTPLTLTLMAMNVPDLVNTAFDSTSGYTGIELSALITGVLRNLSVNPGNEADLSATGLTGIGGGTPALTRVSGGRSGTYAGRVTYNSTATAPGGGAYKDTPVEAGKVYSFGEYYRTSKITRVLPTLDWLKSDGSVVTTINGAQAVTTALPAWGAAPRATITGVTAPTGAVTARFSIESVAGTSYSAWVAANYLEFDDFQVNEGATLQNYTDGNTAGWYWMGNQNASVSAQTPDNITLGAIEIMVIPSGATPRTGRFAPGQGHGGVRFPQDPENTPYNVPLDMIDMTVKFVEVGPWE